MHSDQRLLSVSSYRSGVSCLLAAVVWVAVAGGAFGQDDNAKFSSWAKVEAASETKAYKEAMTGGGAFDATARGFLEQIALPQLQLESNRPTIERIRKRLREFLLGGIANEKSADEATKTVSVFMESLAARNDADPVSRVNAMLLIGELQSPDRKPWPPAAATLAQAVANADLPKAVRIAACVGLAKHVEATRGVVEEQQRLAASRKLIYHFHPDRVRVYFDEARTNDPKEVLLSQRFFHDIELPEEEDSSSQPSFSHPCGPDMYRGRLELCDADSFILHWKVEGPRKLGMQTLLYRRCE